MLFSGSGYFVWSFKRIGQFVVLLAFLESCFPDVPM